MSIDMRSAASIPSVTTVNTGSGTSNGRRVTTKHGTPSIGPVWSRIPSTPETLPRPVVVCRDVAVQRHAHVDHDLAHVASSALPMRPWRLPIRPTNRRELIVTCGWPRRATR